MHASRFPLPVALVAGLALAAIPRSLGAQADPDKAVAGGGSLPEGWRARTERNAPLANVKFVTMGDGLHATLGPAAIFWRDRDTVSGAYHVVASITQMKNPEHPEAYGIFIGGRNLADSTQAYTYFIIRAIDGKYMIRRRAGFAARPTNVVDWTDHPAVVKADGTGKATNELSILVAGGKVSFMVNGKEVYAGDAADLDTSGIVGYRVNHNLDVHLGPLGIHKQ
ncbi:MAG: hypothetical protein ACREL9_13705 [Gemmatimonadales bacterium]